jgi:hypothetical protein
LTRAMTSAHCERKRSTEGRTIESEMNDTSMTAI